jgi:hypothetical protein
MPRRYTYTPCAGRRAKRILAPWWTEYDDLRLRQIEEAQKADKRKR